MIEEEKPMIITNINTLPDAEELGPKKAAKRDEDEETTSEEADDNLKTKNINIFKQQSVKDFFKSTRVIELDEEVRKLEREQRLELKRRGELRWSRRRGEERRRILQEVAMECVIEMIGSTVDRELNKEKFARMGRAKLQSTTARLNMLTISSPAKRKVTETSVVTLSKRRRRLGSKGEEEGRVRSIFDKLSFSGTRLLTSARTSPSPSLPKPPPLTSSTMIPSRGKLSTPTSYNSSFSRQTLPSMAPLPQPSELPINKISTKKF